MRGITSLNQATSFRPGRNWEGGRIPGTQIRFDPMLVDTLVTEHQELLAICEQLEIACEKERTNQIADRLQTLEERIRRHRMQEDIKLMIFIEKRYSDNDQMAMLLSMFRKERDGLKRQLGEFFAKYALLRECPSLITELREDVGKAIKMVMAMVECEEQNFFPLYSLELQIDYSDRPVLAS